MSPKLPANAYVAVAAAREMLGQRTADAIDALVERAVEWEPEDDAGAAFYAAIVRLGAQRALALARLEARNNSSSIKASVQTDATLAARMTTTANRKVLSWELPNGSQLGAASVADIEDAIAKHRVKALAHAGWVKFYAAVKAKMVAAKVHSVGELFSEPELLKLSAANGVKEDA